MTKDFPAITKRISDDIKKLRKDIPDTLNGFSALANAALRGSALDKKTKELVALALGVAAHCDGVSASMPKRWLSWAPAAKRSRRRLAWQYIWAEAPR